MQRRRSVRLDESEPSSPATWVDQDELRSSSGRRSEDSTQSGTQMSLWAQRLKPLPKKAIATRNEVELDVESRPGAPQLYPALSDGHPRPWAAEKDVDSCYVSAEILPRPPHNPLPHCPALMQADDYLPAKEHEVDGTQLMCGVNVPSYKRLALAGCCLILVLSSLAAVSSVLLLGMRTSRSSSCPFSGEHPASHKVKMVMALPYSSEDFAGHKRTFTQVVAEVLSIHECAVNIALLLPRRRSLVSQTYADLSVDAESSRQADSMASSLQNLTSINSKLAEHGLKSAAIAQPPSVVSKDTWAANSIPCPPGFALVNSQCAPCAKGTFKANFGPEQCSMCPKNTISPAGSTAASACMTSNTPLLTTASAPPPVPVSVSMEQLREHASPESCWVAVHGKVLDVTQFLTVHPGGANKLACGTDITDSFERQHGMLTVLDDKLAGTYGAYLRVVGVMMQVENAEAAAAAAASTSTPSTNTSNPSTLSTAAGKGAFDFSKKAKQVHPGNGREFKTLVYIELKGAWDGASGFVNVKNEAEVHLWCSKRPTLSASEYCECLRASIADGTCSKYVFKTWTGSEKMFPLQHTDGYLAMTDLLASGDTGWLSLWNQDKMSVVPGVGRSDHARSHFLVKDAAAKGVSVDEEKQTSNGWLAKSIFAYKNLYCSPGEAVAGATCSPPTGSQPAGPTMVDGISFAQAAAGPNALEASEAIAVHGSYFHFTGVQSVDSIKEQMAYDYLNPFERMMALARTRRGFREMAYRDDDARQQSRLRTDEELWAESTLNPGLTDLLAKEETIFQGLGIMKDKLEEYKERLASMCPGGFPPMEQWADSSSDAEIGMQLRAVAILLVNGVRPRVFQLQQTRYDTHSNQAARLKVLLSDLKTGVYTFVQAAERCGFWDEVLVTTFSDFGRRLEENSRKGTDHGWGSYYVVFGKDLARRVLGYNAASNSSALSDVVPFQADAYDASKQTKGDLPLTTDLETWNACILNALALPGLPRLGPCPSDLQIRTGLANVPVFDETEYYATAAARNASLTSIGDYTVCPFTLCGPLVTCNPHSTSSGSSASSYSAIPGDGDTSHLHTPLTRAQVLYFSRRVGYSVRSLGLDAFFIPNASQVANEESGRRAGQSLPTLTLKQAIAKALADDNTNNIADRQPEIFLNYHPREHNVIKLWTSERREKRNNWGDVLKVPYPRYDPVQRRLKRWHLEKFFNTTSLTVDPKNDWNGFIQIAPGYSGREHQLLEHLQEHATLFFMPGPVHKDTGKIKSSLLDSTSSAYDPTKVDWYKTVMQVPDVKEIVALSFEKIVHDWKCVNGSHPDDASIPCDSKCDLRNLLTIDYKAQTAMLTDTSRVGPDNTRVSAPWKILQQCMATDQARKTFEVARYNVVKGEVQDHTMEMYVNDFTKPKYGLRARMTWFWLNRYATPSSTVNDWLLMYQQYYTVWTGALGNYRALSRKMFRDTALRKSLDQAEEIECGTAPIENFAREWLERFTVGLMAHNEGDVKRLARGLMNCKENAETFNADLITPGVIFSNVNETLWTVTEAEQNAVIDRILDYRSKPDEPPAAAQFLCSKLYEEFGRLPQDGILSSTGFAPEVVRCAEFLYDHNYDILYALTAILEDKTYFQDTLGTKKRWPMAVVLEPVIDLDFLHIKRNDGSNVWSAHWVKNKLNEVGMRPFEPQDVSGFALDTVWTLDRLTKAHKFLETTAWVPQTQLFSTDDFNTPETLASKLAPYSLGPSAPTKYSYSMKVCGPDLFVETNNQEGNQTIDSATLFQTHPNPSSRYNAWKESIRLSVTNVCRFVC